MINPIYEKLAKIVVHYSLEIGKGHTVLITGPSFAKDLFQALNKEMILVGAHPLILPVIEGIQETIFKYASEEQLTYVSKLSEVVNNEYDRLIEIRADFNTRKFSNVDPKKLSIFMSAPKRKELREIQNRRTASGEFKWLVLAYPCNAHAQEASMDLLSYTEFVHNSLFLDKENPIEEWRKMQKQQDILVEYLNKIEKIHVIGEDTDLILSVKERKWLNSSGQRNLPDGEVHTAPIENVTNGHIRFTYPGIYMGNEVEDIYLEFKDGKVINANAEKGDEILQKILQVENADRLGEFAIGNNFGITKFTKSILFDEKMGGTLHCALGFGSEMSGSKNKSSVHWDMIKDMKAPGSKILADDKVIYEEGKWKI